MSFEHTADSTRQADVPRGSVTRSEWQSKIMGSTRDYWVYVPAQYRDEQPAALMIFQDGQHYVDEDGPFRVPVVFDNLIHQRAMPVTIGLFLNPGHSGKSPPETPFQCDQRSYEYDALTEKYSRLLIEEMIPELGRHWRVSTDPRRRALAGLSSGGICAFTAAWQRPDCFHKVMSHVGSFVDIRGGHNYPFYIRQWAKRDIKVFLQSGEHDLETQFGHWWLANLQMEAALKWRGYDYEFVGGSGGHDGQHGGSILPDSLRWLWSDVPAG